MDGCQIDPGIRDYVPQRRSGISLIAEQPFRRVQDSLLCFGHSIALIKQLYYTTDFGIVKCRKRRLFGGMNRERHESGMAML
jgi:hypothetical protein